MLFPIWPNGLAQTLVAIKRSPLILSKGLHGFTVLLQTADGAGRVHRARGGAHPLVRVPAEAPATGRGVVYPAWPPTPTNGASGAVLWNEGGGG